MLKNTICKSIYVKGFYTARNIFNFGNLYPNDPMGAIECSRPIGSGLKLDICTCTYLMTMANALTRWLLN